MSYLDEFMDKMNTFPNDVNRLLRLIRLLDKRVQECQCALNTMQHRFLTQLKDSKERKSEAMKNEYEAIVRKQKEMVGYAKEKKETADQLYEEIKEYSSMLKNEVDNKVKDKPEEEYVKRKKQKQESAKAVNGRREEFYYDKVQPKYCYCGQGSHGEMVLCENPYCEKQWFHVTCIEEKNLPDKWFCLDCHKQREKTKNPLSRNFYFQKEI